MRALRVVGLSDDGKSVICEDHARSERFTIEADERLRAAARGDVTRLGQIEIELESQMRPREIQTRIRAGESVEQVAAAAGVPQSKIERYAYPVLLERSRTADLAQRAHPIREDGPDVQTLTEITAHAFGLRGQDYSTATWDSWRGEDAKWVVQLQWHTGHTLNRAHWVFHPGAHGGTVVALDDHAKDLMDPNAGARPLRTVRPVTELARQALEAHGPAPVDRPAVEPEPEQEILAAEDVAGVPEPTAVEEPAEPAPAMADPEPVAEPVAAPATPPAAAVSPGSVGTDNAADETSEPARKPEPARKTEPAASKRGKKNHPIVPSWEDVLLGVRTQRG
ncbi:MAG TPA: septation protein SepH [Pseudonocardiaceae bacterium]|nr:septation protein SepH [Pseudonocardiaceae bacterium]